MGQVLWQLFIIVLGFGLSYWLFQDFPRLEASDKKGVLPELSVIIPVRNEEKNISRQTLRPGEIICVDDASTDRTAEIIAAFPFVRYLKAEPKPPDYIGKSWACLSGAKAASGEVFLFLDADVRLGKTAVAMLAESYKAEDAVLSVQPYHIPECFYEQFSFFFNLIQIAANGTTRPAAEAIGLHGPVILIDKASYEAAGTHEAVKDSLIEDLALGKRLREKEIPFKLFTADKSISYRMYPQGFRALCEGWIKNIALGASETGPAAFAAIFFWLASLSNVFTGLLSAALHAKPLPFLLYAVFYLLWLLRLSTPAGKCGQFKKTTIIFYPLFLAFSIVILLISAAKMIFAPSFRWKGRTVEGKKR